MATWNSFAFVLFSIIFVMFSVINSNWMVRGANPNIYTNEDLNAIDKFRPLVTKHLTMDFHKTNAYLLRWIRGSKFDLKSAADDLQRHHQWRIDHKIDSILDKSEIIPSDLPYTLEGFDKGGRPVILHPFGKWNIRKYVLAGKQALVVRQYQRMYEAAIRKAFRIAETKARDVDQIYVLTDLQGYTLRTHSCLGCVPVTLSFATTFNSGVIPFSKNITLVNSPQIFEPVLSLARAIVSKVPIRDYDHNKQVWMPLLLADIDRDQLPFSLGGTREE